VSTILWQWQTIAYLRVSTGTQGLAQQKLAIFDHARKHRLTVDDFVEARSSAGRSTPWAPLLALIETLQTKAMIALFGVVYSKRAVNTRGLVQTDLRTQNDPLRRPQMGWSPLHSTPYDGLLTPLASRG
jgi:hypothetical protein